MLVVLETLSPAERLAFVLHDMFAVPFDEIAPIVGRSPEATRQLASRGRRRVRGATPDHPGGAGRAAARRRRVPRRLPRGDFAGLLEVLDPDVVFRVDAGPDSPLARAPVVGADAVARQVLARGARIAPLARPALVNGMAGALWARPNGRSPSSGSRSPAAASRPSTSSSTGRSCPARRRKEIDTPGGAPSRRHNRATVT